MATNMSSPLQNMLFYSVKCQHSIGLLQYVKTNVPPEISNNIVFYCIDNPSIKIPQFIKVVPSLYIPSQRSVITDNDIGKWFNMATQQYRANMSAVSSGRQQPNSMQQQQQARQPMSQMQSNVINNADITGDPSISAYLPAEMSHGSNINYTYIDDDSGVGKDFFHISAEMNQSPQSEQFNNKGMLGMHAFTRPPGENEVRARTEGELTETIPIRQGPPPPQGGGPMSMSMGGGGSGMGYNQPPQPSMTYNPNMNMGGGGGGGGPQTLPFEQIKVEKGSKSGSSKLQYQQMIASRGEEFKGSAPRF